MTSSVCEARRVVDFKGSFNIEKKRFDIVLESQQNGKIVLKGRNLSEHDYHLSVDCQHVKTRQFDYSSQVDVSIDLSRVSETDCNNISGKVWSQYSLLNYKPTRELSGRFEVKDNRLFLHSFFFADLSARGYIDLKAPNKMDLEFALFSIGMDDFLDFWIKKRKYDATGLVSGTINVSGDKSRLYLKGALEGYDGFIKRLHYDKIQLNAEGEYPDLYIADSVFSKSDGVSFVIRGKVDLSDQKNFSRQIKALTIMPLVSDSASQVEWTIKRLDSGESGSVELKYLLRDDDDIDFSEEEGLDMFGVQRTMQF